MVHDPPAASIFSRADFENACAVTASFFASSPWPRTFTGTPRREAARDQRVRRDAVAVAEARLEVAQVHRLGVGAEVLERHRLLHVRPAQLAQPHVDRHLAALGARARLEAAPGAGALLAATGGLADAGALAAADALLAMPRARRRLQVVEPDLLWHLVLDPDEVLDGRDRATDGGLVGALDRAA